jgi:glyoxylase-like metal-dependent hydrolase (beta-lactamase superfamily II)
MSATRLYAFHCGYERFPNAIFEPSHPDPGAQREIPYFFFLIDHPRGKILFEAGPHPKLISDPTGHLGPEAGSWGIDVTPEDDARAKLAAIDVVPEEISHIIVSHLHYDHAGGLVSFPHAKLHLQKAEYGFARKPPLYQEGLFVPAEFDFPAERFVFYEREHDLFGDGSLVLIPTPGHTPGHQSLIVRLSGGNYILAADAIYEPEFLNIANLPAGNLVWCADEMVNSRLLLQTLCKEEPAVLIATHDIEFRTRIRCAPDAWYE